MEIKVGDKAPHFSLKDQNGNLFNLSQKLDAGCLVIYFYPKDDTPGCTAQSCAFRDSYEDFKDAGAEVIGISSDSQTSHEKFAQRHNLPFTLLADSDGKVRQLFGVPKTFGLFPGRVTYVIDQQGIVRFVFNSPFAATKHVPEALQIIRSLTNKS